ncbi:MULTISPECIES: hypothetical protein [Rhizobium]|uniref:hypothetical protein n=1 Tax=Rhizobium TaxID=379 RepID=UPI0019574F9D|nr:MULTISPECIES: hypothetical protein [Rhizobium]MBM7045406.1 hypothetical protein [Rhizobium lusitanum]
MYNLEAALVYHWHMKTVSEGEILEMADLGGVVRRTMIGFACLVVLILCLSWAAEPDNGRPQAAAADQAYSTLAER